MAYNGGFPATYPMYYQPQFQQPVMQQPSPQPQQQNSIIWVQGEAGAKSYLVAPNTTVQLWDSERQTIYLKSADASGMPSIKTLDYVIRDAAPQAAPAIREDVYATRADVEALAGRFDELRARFDALKGGAAE